MKNLKISMMLLLTLAIFTNCEKETVINESLEKNELNNFDLRAGRSNSEFDIETYKPSLSKQSKKSNISSKMVDEESGLTYFFDKEEFDLNNCNNLALEDFESSMNIVGEYNPFWSPLNSETDNSFYSLGDISENVVFYASEGPWEGDLVVAGGYLFYNSTFIRTHYTDSDYTIHYLNIGFSNDDVYSVSMDLLSAYNDNLPMKIEFYGDNGIIGSLTVPNITLDATYLGINSNTPIKRITLNLLGWGWEGIDNLRFGTCIPDTDEDGILNADDNCPSTPNAGQADNDEDGIGDVCDDDDDNDGILDENDNCPFSANANQANYDGDDEGDVCDDDGDNDGVMNNKDAHIYSLLGGKIHILDCYPNVNNVLVRNGSSMMDQIGDLINEINAEYNGSNYDYLHRKFIMLLERKVTDWRRNRLVNNSQRDAILRCAGSASIPYTDQ